MRESINPLIKLPAHLHERGPNIAFPLGDERHAGRVLNDCAVGERLDGLVLLHVVLVLLVDVDEALLAHHAEEAAPRVHFLGEKDGRPVVVLTVDSQGRVGHLLVRSHHEGLVEEIFVHMALHELGRLPTARELVDYVHGGSLALSFFLLVHKGRALCFFCSDAGL